MISRIPKRIVSSGNRLSLTKFSQFIGKTDEEIKSNSYSGIYIDGFDMLKNNFDLFQRIVALKNINKFFSKSFECLKYIEENLKDYETITLSLIDDFQNKDRSYIDLNQFQKTSIEIPFSYVLWNPQLQENQRISLYSDKKTLNPYSTNLYNKISTENLKKIKEIIYKLSDKYKCFSEKEKIILISNYLQNLVQFVDKNNISESISGTYITDSDGLVITTEMVGSPENVLLQNFGVCNGIANAATILLNNPELNVNMRSVHGLGHAWNVVLVEGQNYYVDITWDITRNKNRYPESLKAKSFNSDFLFFGTDTATKIGHHEPNSFCPFVEKADMSKEEINFLQKKLVRVANFSDYNKPIFDSKLLK